MNRARENFLKILSSVLTKASVETDQNPSLGENNSNDSTNKNKIQGIKSVTLLFKYY